MLCLYFGSTCKSDGASCHIHSKYPWYLWAMQAKNPARDLPIALFTSLGVSSVVYILMACAITLMVPYKLIDLQAPFSVAFHTAHEPWLAQLVSIGAVIAIGTVLIVSLWSRPSLAFPSDMFWLPDMRAVLYDCALIYAVRWGVKP